MLSSSLAFIFLHSFLLHTAPHYLNAWNRLQLTTLLGQQCWELLLSFARSLTCVAFVSISFVPLHPIPSRFSCPSPTLLKVDGNDACYPAYWTAICRSSFSGYNSFILGLGSIGNIFRLLFSPPYSARPANQAIRSNSVNS